MLRKITMILLSMTMFLSAMTACAEKIDLTQMTTEELFDLRARINAELVVRPGGEDMILGVGTYVVGRDLQPGMYYAIFESGNTLGGGISVYENDTMDKEIGDIYATMNTYSIYPLVLKEGNCVVINNYTFRVNSVGFPDYHAPEGTIVPAGVYEVGVDFPAGRYNVSMYKNGAYVAIFMDMESYTKSDSIYDGVFTFYLGGTDRECVINVKDGDILVIESSSVVMNKATAITFD